MIHILVGILAVIFFILLLAGTFVLSVTMATDGMTEEEKEEYLGKLDASHIYNNNFNI